MEPARSEVWTERVARWRASGEKAEAFSRREGYAAGTLRWWASRLKRETPETAPPEQQPVVQLARVVRKEPAAAISAMTRQAIVLEVVDTGVRIAVEPDADPATLAMVLGVVRAVGGGR